MITIKLEEWAIIGLPKDCYKPPELRALHLLGKVYGHPEYKDGDDIVTSSIVHADGKEILTFNSKYILGNACEEYKKWYSHQYDRDLNENNPFA